MNRKLVLLPCITLLSLSPLFNAVKSWAETVTFQPSRNAVIVRYCKLDGSSTTPECDAAINAVKDNFYEASDKILSLNFDKDGYPIAIIKMTTPWEDGTECYQIKFGKNNVQRFGSPCSLREIVVGNKKQ